MSLLRTLGKAWRTTREQGAARRLRQLHVGEGSILSPSVQVYGWEFVRVGRNTMVSEDTLIIAMNCPSDVPIVVIGDHCFLGRRNFLSAGISMKFGDYCLTGPNCHFLGSDHIHSSPFVPYLLAGTTGGGAISLGANCWLGAGVTVLKDVAIGFGSIIGAAAVVTRSIPPLSVAVGNPARVLKRYDLARSQWMSAADFREAEMMSEADYVAALHRSHPQPRMPRQGVGREWGDS